MVDDYGQASTGLVSNFESKLRTHTLSDICDDVHDASAFVNDLNIVYKAARFTIDMETCLLMLLVNGNWWMKCTVIRRHQFVATDEWQPVAEADVPRIRSLMDLHHDINLGDTPARKLPDQEFGLQLGKHNAHFESFTNQHGGALFVPSANSLYEPCDKDFLRCLTEVLSYCVDKFLATQQLQGTYFNLKNSIKQWQAQVSADGKLPFSAWNSAWNSRKTSTLDKPGFLRCVEYMIDMELKGSRVVVLAIEESGIISSLFDETLDEAVLQQITDHIRSKITEKQSLCYLGRGEFAFIITAPAENQSEVYLQAMRKAFDDDLLINGYRANCRVYAGYSCYPHCARKPEELLRCASVAMLQARKHNSRELLAWSDPLVQRVQTQLELTRELYNATENSEFTLSFQPIRTVDNKHTSGYEALIRWQHPKRGILLPELFITAAEESHNIVVLGKWVLNRVCRYLRTTKHDAYVSINLSARQLEENELVNRINRTLREYGIDRERILFEVTETVALVNHQQTHEVFTAFKQSGYRMCVDDFGTGYSSLSYLLNYPFDIVKLDRSFIHNASKQEDGIALGDDDDKALGQNIVELAKQLGMSVICEGIETAEQLALANHWGADGVQGLYISDAKPWDALFPKKQPLREVE